KDEFIRRLPIDFQKDCLEAGVKFSFEIGEIKRLLSLRGPIFKIFVENQLRRELHLFMEKQASELLTIETPNDTKLANRVRSHFNATTKIAQVRYTEKHFKE